MKLPNGFGSIHKMSGNRRKPWCARKTTGWNEKGHPVYYYVGYYRTKAEAMEALALFNRSPNAQKATFKEVLDLWWEEAEQTSKSAVRIVCESVMPRFKPLLKMRMQDIRLTDMENLVRNETKFVGKNIKTVLGKVFDYAVHHEFVSADRRELVRHIQLADGQSRKVERKIFTREEEANITEPELLILLYTGLRVGELLDLREEDVHIDERWLFVRKAKTKTGIRKVPIAEKIVPLFGCIPTNLRYEQMYDLARKYGHTPHDTRHTFISRMADLGVDERVTKAIVGHRGTDITETVYTHIDMDVLLKAVNCL